MASQFRIARTDKYIAPDSSNLLVAKLSTYLTLGPVEQSALRRLSAMCRYAAADEILIHQDGTPCSMFMIVRGLAYRYRYLANGKRQIFGYLLPGDLCDAQFLISNEIDHDIAMLTDGVVAAISARDLIACAHRSPVIRQALLRSTRAESACLREWLVNLGCRPALQRLAWFLCETVGRLQGVGAFDDGVDVTIPLSQLHLADTMGLTVGHVSRCMQQFERSGLIVSARGELQVLDRDGLKEIADCRTAHVAHAVSAMPLLEMVN